MISKDSFFKRAKRNGQPGKIQLQWAEEPHPAGSVCLSARILAL